MTTIERLMKTAREQIQRNYINAAEMQKSMPKNQVRQFLQDYKPFVNKFFGDLTVKTIRYDDEIKQFCKTEINCAESWNELYNTIDRFHNQEKYYNEEDPSFRVWVEKQNTFAAMEGY
jgi:hypothetical protein